MNLNKLFEIQAGLDYHIIKEKGLEGKYLLDMKILSLQVELGECANELPEVFKFWANKKNDYDKALKEYVDCLHFILSIGLEFKIPDEWIVENIIKELTEKEDSIEEQFIAFNQHLNTSMGANDWFDILGLFIGLGEMLGFTTKQIEQAYLDKNKINHERQLNGY